MYVNSQEDIIDMLEEVNLRHIEDKIKKLVKESIFVSTNPTKEENIKIGESKIGGVPDLPKDEKWVIINNRPLSFLAQLNLKEVKNYLNESLLPDKGMLYFFYDAENQPWGDEYSDKEGWKVIYSDKDVTNLERKDPPNNLMQHYIFNPCKLDFKKEMSLPVYNSIYFDEIELNRNEEKKLKTFLYKINPEKDKPWLIHRIMGYPEPLEGDMMTLCHFTSNGIELNDDDEEKINNYLEEKYNKESMMEWRLLFQLDSDEMNAGMAWGDFGRLFFWIKNEDLKNKNFDNVWVILQSG